MPICHHPVVEMTLRFEIFPDDLDATVDFYMRVLRFRLTADRRGQPGGVACVSEPPGGQVRMSVPRGCRLPGWSWCSKLMTSLLSAIGLRRRDGRWRRISRTGLGA